MADAQCVAVTRDGCAHQPAPRLIGQAILPPHGPLAALGRDDHAPPVAQPLHVNLPSAGLGRFECQEGRVGGEARPVLVEWTLNEWTRRTAVEREQPDVRARAVRRLQESDRASVGRCRDRQRVPRGLAIGRGSVAAVSRDHAPGGCAPSASRAQISKGPSVRAAKYTVRPSADQTGELFTPLCVRRIAAPRRTSATQTSVRAPSVFTPATRDPSGDSVALRSSRISSTAGSVPAAAVHHDTPDRDDDGAVMYASDPDGASAYWATPPAVASGDNMLRGAPAVASRTASNATACSSGPRANTIASDAAARASPDPATSVRHRSTFEFSMDSTLVNPDA